MIKIVPYLPHTMAVLNGLTIIFLMAGFVAIRHDKKELHKKFMLTAVVVGFLFLVAYLAYHAVVGNVAFAGRGIVRITYFGILVAHVLTAAAIVFMVPVTLIRAWRQRLDAHRQVARKTLPTWLFVSISGLVVYAMAFHFYS